MEDNQGAPQEFFNAVGEKLAEINELVKEFNLEEEWVSAFIGGIYSKNSSGENKLKTVLDYCVVDEEELDEILSISASYYQSMDAPKLPVDLQDTKDWTSEDWIGFINHNTDENGSAN